MTLLKGFVYCGAVYGGYSIGVERGYFMPLTEIPDVFKRITNMTDDAAVSPSWERGGVPHIVSASMTHIEQTRALASVAPCLSLSVHTCSRSPLRCL